MLPNLEGETALKAFILPYHSLIYVFVCIVINANYFWGYLSLPYACVCVRNPALSLNSVEHHAISSLRQVISYVPQSTSHQ